MRMRCEKLLVENGYDVIESLLDAKLLGLQRLFASFFVNDQEDKTRHPWIENRERLDASLRRYQMRRIGTPHSRRGVVVGRPVFDGRCHLFLDADTELGFMGRPIVRVCSLVGTNHVQRPYDINLVRPKHQTQLAVEVDAYLEPV